MESINANGTRHVKVHPGQSVKKYFGKGENGSSANNTSQKTDGLLRVSEDLNSQTGDNMNGRGENANSKYGTEIKSLSSKPQRAPLSRGNAVTSHGDGMADNERSVTEAWGVPENSEKTNKVKSDKKLNNAAKIVCSFWRQMANKDSPILPRLDERKEIEKEVNDVLKDPEVRSKDKLFKEVKYIIRNFRERRCINFCKEENKLAKLMRKTGIKNFRDKEFCVCGLPRDLHTLRASHHRSSTWTTSKNTELLLPCAFGNMDIPGHYNYVDMPEGTRKYIRFDDLDTNPDQVWELLTKHWNLKSPNFVISVTGGDVTNLQQNKALNQSFIRGILKTVITTKAWIITDGFNQGSTREMSAIFQDHLQRSEWSEHEDHANVPLIAITPWGLVDNSRKLSFINVGSQEAVYVYSSSCKTDSHSHTAVAPNSLDPNHVIYLLPDDGTTGRYKNEPRIRSKLEKYIRKNTSLKVLGEKDMKTPVVILVLGGDRFTLEKLADATSAENQISIVVVNGSGPLASMLGEIYQRLENVHPRSKDGWYGWSQEEEDCINMMIIKYEADGLLPKARDKADLSTTMKARHLIEVFGITERDTKDLDKAMVEATFGGTKDIEVQLNIALALNRCDLASSFIFLESRKDELYGASDTLQEVLIVAMETGRKRFVELLLDEDYGGQLDFKKLLTVERLHRLHSSNLDPSCIMGKLLRSMCKRDTNGSFLLEDHQLLPQVGRIIYELMGNNYGLLYQEQEYKKVCNEPIPLRLTQNPKEEPVWHLLIWACLANQKEMAEVFLFETSCKIGAALIACEMFLQLSKRVALLSETQLSDQLRQNGEYFQTIAIETLENLYHFDRDEAYASITTVIPFRWSYYATPLFIADDTEAMRFMGHACCQTLLNRIWYKYMDMDTSSWRLFPLFLFFPFNLMGIVFDKTNLNYGTFSICYEDINHKSSKNLHRQRSKNEIVHAQVNDAFGSTHKLHDSDSKLHNSLDQESVDETEQRKRKESFCETAWFRFKNYYTAPINKFIFYFMAWLAFISVFTHFLLSELRPISTLSEVTVCEWLTMLWVVCISLDEIKQLAFTRSSGPLYKLGLRELWTDWSDSWHIQDLLFFTLGLYKVVNWLEDIWNKIDVLMLLLFWTSVVCRFTLKPSDFTLVRILYSVTLIIAYYRILRIGYIMKNIGPRIITIHAMMHDLTNFMLILCIFILSFGVAFQAILNPMQPASIEQLVDVLWRPYWQMFGNLFIDDAITGMGREKPDQNVCTYNRTLSDMEPEMHPFCYHWMAPVLLAAFMLFTNILLLNLLIAIFSNSFEKIECEAQMIWRYHLYDLVHEYYHQSWLPPPLSLLCHVYDIVKWLFKLPRKWAYTAAKRRHTKALEARRGAEDVEASSDESYQNMLEKQVEEEIKKDVCYRFYLDDTEREEISHLRQPEIMRNEDMEEKAYKRYLRSTAKEKQRDTFKMLKSQNERLCEISADMQHFRENGNTTTSETPSEKHYRHPSPSEQNTSVVDNRIDRLEKRMENKMAHLDQKLDSILRLLSKSGSP